MNKTSNKAFTLVELIVTITILAVLGTIWFVSLNWYAASARDAVRTSDMTSIVKILEHWVLFSWSYPLPDNSSDITFSWSLAWKQWSFWDWARRATRWISEIPTDPLTWQEYTYSLHNNSSEYQLWGVAEDSLATSWIYNETFADVSDFRSVIKWNYNGVWLKVPHWDGNTSILAVPSIIASKITSPTTTLDSILSAKTLSYNWESCYGHTYATDSACSNLVNSNPDIFEAFSWSLNDLRASKDLRVQMIKNMQNAYLGSAITLSSALEKIQETTILVSEPSDDAYILANETAQYSLGLNLLEEEEWPVDPYSLVFQSANYNSNWISNSCWTDIAVKYLDPTVPTDVSSLINLDENTVYVLSAWTYTMTEPIDMDNCSAIIWIGDVNLRTSVQKGSLIAINNKSNVIVDNFNLNWFNGTAVRNNSGISIINWSTNSTIKNIVTSASDRGVTVETLSNNITIENIKAFNNTEFWLNLESTTFNKISNIIAYNNNDTDLTWWHWTWIFINWSDNNYFNNISTYNNSQYWLVITEWSDYNTFNNISVFNNSSHWLFFNTWTPNVLNNILVYKNASLGSSYKQTYLIPLGSVINDAMIFSDYHWKGISVSGNSSYFGTISALTNPSPWSVNNLTASSANAFWLAWNTPISSLTFDSTYAVIPSWTWSNTTEWRQSSASLDGETTYTFGSNIASQIQPVKYNWTTLEVFGSFDASKKIGEW